MFQSNEQRSVIFVRRRTSSNHLLAYLLPHLNFFTEVMILGILTHQTVRVYAARTYDIYAGTVSVPRTTMLYTKNAADMGMRIIIIAICGNSNALHIFLKFSILSPFELYGEGTSPSDLA